MKLINSKKARQPLGHYSQAVEANNTLYISGQLGLTNEDNIDVLKLRSKEALIEQTTKALWNIEQILLEAKYTINNLVKVNIYLSLNYSQAENFGYINEVYSKFMKEHKPARAFVVVAALPKDAIVEIEAIAVK
ncbi:2-iminobutanoate/2-iminopropanoate deaminase [Mycoplasma testudineum]|uniref:2-iminobutanoate/2-iminopropanoate deaminase n=1 Tax=Mycoplasma testudineum TaxID=244584 RepID=A0A4R6IE47_9MOLU|nr:Rid family detoxifying hydrolase [Mycoplasma testudineum]OYD26995.1 hypothetical protein CG473_01520 [Mycoplasma testudineum]TDO20543.1 2-iminobutanoate/2-iminopropanoate deaminase [Mycoplasma testudineum]